MKVFQHAEIKEAIEWARAGGVALHVWQPGGGWSGAPAIFQHEAAAGRPWGHLYDTDPERLRRTARRLGVRRIVIHVSARIPVPHVDLCGRPLAKAIVMCRQIECGEEVVK